MTDTLTAQVNPKQEAADFYIGRGPNAEFIGCIADDGAPEGYDPWGEGALDAFFRFQSTTDHEFTDEDFRAKVADLPAVHADWVHEWNSSRDTPWCYMYDKGTVFVYRFGVEMGQLRCNFTRWAPRRVRNDDGTVTTYPGEMVRVPRDTAHDKFPTMRKESKHA